MSTSRLERTHSHAHTLPAVEKKDEPSKEGNNNRRGDNQICMLKTSPPLMMDAPITNYHATSVRANHNIYHVSCHTPRSLRVAAAATTTPASDNRQTGPHQQQATTASTSTLIDPPASIRFILPTGIISPFKSCNRRVGHILNQASRAASGQPLLGRRELLAQAPLRMGGAPPSC
jgi:hypothetical protein